MPDSIELFAGGGGMALGLHLAGFEHRHLVEWDAQACQTLRLNATYDDPTRGHPVWKPDAVVNGDVREWLTHLHDTSADLVAGGPPCQPFSLGGVHAGDADPRNMFPAALDVVRATAPKLVIFENVPGLLRSGFLPYFDYVAEQLTAPSIEPRPFETWQEHRARVIKGAPRSELRYRVDRQVILSADLGVPQIRKRVFLIGIREDLNAAWLPLSADYTEDALLHDQYVSGIYWEEHQDSREVKEVLRRGLPQAPPRVQTRVARLAREGRPVEKRWRTVRDMLRDPEVLPEPIDAVQRGKWPNHIGVPGAKSYVGHTGSDIDLPAKTIKAGVHGVCGGEAMIKFRDGSLRYMTTREAARVQGFPDWYEFTGARSLAMRHIGNAVAVAVAQAVGERLRQLTGV
jgi:DNA (cytosine-5)-methyltransferase 1